MRIFWVFFCFFQCFFHRRVFIFKEFPGRRERPSQVSLETRPNLLSVPSECLAHDLTAGSKRCVYCCWARNRVDRCCGFLLRCQGLSHFNKLLRKNADGGAEVQRPPPTRTDSLTGGRAIPFLIQDVIEPTSITPQNAMFRPAASGSACASDAPRLTQVSTFAFLAGAPPYSVPSDRNHAVLSEQAIMRRGLRGELAGSNVTHERRVNQFSGRRAQVSDWCMSGAMCKGNISRTPRGNHFKFGLESRAN